MSLEWREWEEEVVSIRVPSWAIANFWGVFICIYYIQC